MSGRRRADWLVCGFQTTIRSPVRFAHKGLLTGRTTSVRLRPAPPNTGIVFNREIPARPANAFVEQHLVGLQNGSQTVLGVEHLLAACYGLGIDNLRVEVAGGEVPFGDGSALPFVRILQAAGRRRQSAPRVVQSLVRPIVIHQPACGGNPESEALNPKLGPGISSLDTRISREAGEAFICALPPAQTDGRSDGLNCNCLIRFPAPAIGEQSLGGTLSAEFFLHELAPARTFGFAQEGRPVSSWLSRYVQRKDGILLPTRPRFADEPVRHKLLDLLGDLCLLGRRLQANIFAWRAGHVLHHRLLKELEEMWT